MKHYHIVWIIIFLQENYKKFTKFRILNLLHEISAIPEENLTRIKTKLRSTCEKYYHGKPYFKYNQVIQNLSKNKEIVILRQDEGRGVVILGRSKYMENFLSILSTTQFSEMVHDPTAYIERKV